MAEPPGPLLPPTSPPLPGTGRIEAFSDGVIAIIVTFMVLDLKLPAAAASGGLWPDMLLPLLPKVAAYAWSFLLVAAMWVNHHQLMHTVRHATLGLLWCNALLLFWLSLIPLVTGFVGEHPEVPRAVASYGFVLFASAGSFTVLRAYAARHERANPAVAALHAAIIRKSAFGTMIYAAATPLAYVSVHLAMAMFVAVPAMFLMQTRPGRVGGPATRRPAPPPA